jgi:hypothetical protein
VKKFDLKPGIFPALITGMLSMGLIFTGCSGVEVQKEITPAKAITSTSDSRPSASPASSKTTSSAGPSPSSKASPDSVKSAAKAVSMSVKTDKDQVNPGDAFCVEVILNSSVQLKGAQCGVEFDPALMECKEVTEGTYFKEWASSNGVSTILFPKARIDNEKGNVSTFGIAIAGQTDREMKDAIHEGPKGQSVFCSFTMIARSAINSKLDLTLVDIVASDKDSISIEDVDISYGQLK